MEAIDLKEIKDYWSKKYPNVLVNLWSNEYLTKFFGRMTASNESIDLNADSIGDLISQGESFLRRVV